MLNASVPFSSKKLHPATAAGVDRRQWVKTLYYNQYHRYSVNSGKLGQGSHSYSKSMNLSYEAYASYTKDFLDDHHIDAVAGWSFFEEKGTEAFSMTNRNFIRPSPITIPF